MEAKKSGEARTSKVGFEAATQSKGEPGRPSQSKATSAAPEQANAETEPEQPKATPKEIAAEKQGKNESSGENKKKRKVKDPNAKPQREYLGWEDANDIEWRTEIEYVGYKNWKMKFGPGTEWMDRYEKWICSGMKRGAMRKPSYRGVEWVKYQRGIEVAPVGECCTRNRTSIRDYFMEPLDNYCCRPCPWPIVTSGEIGWLGQHKSCQLEIYPNDFMKKPPLPWHHKKISSFLPGSM